MDPLQNKSEFVYCCLQWINTLSIELIQQKSEKQTNLTFIRMTARYLTNYLSICLTSKCLMHLTEGRNCCTISHFRYNHHKGCCVDIMKSYLRLEGNEVLFVLVVHLACDDVCDIHYCREKNETRIMSAQSNIMSQQLWMNLMKNKHLTFHPRISFCHLLYRRSQQIHIFDAWYLFIYLKQE